MSPEAALRLSGLAEHQKARSGASLCACVHQNPPSALSIAPPNASFSSVVLMNNS
jgi:hypothetical protein